MVDSKPRKCRERHGVPMDPEVYRLWTCAECYGYLFPNRRLKPLFPKYLVLSENGSDEGEIKVFEADPRDEFSSVGVCGTLGNDECSRWISCCTAAHDCCERQLAENVSISNQFCPRTWDGWGCWDDTTMGTTSHMSCPDFILYSIPSSYAAKKCNSNGTWFQKELFEWTDYRPCLDKEGLVKTVFISLACNVASILALTPACAIFIFFRGLRRQHRIRVHINFFLSFILSGLCVILWDSLITYDKLTNPSMGDTRMYQNNIECKILSFLKIYFKSTNYVWMFCEGCYLHRLLSNAFTPPKTLVPLYIGGWGVPVISSVIYSILRVIYANQSCWAISFGEYEWIIYAPNLISLVTNLVFLCNILRILTTQIHVHPNEPSSFRRAFKATFVLLPLFGMQLFVTIYRLPPGTPGEASYEQFTICVRNSQGLFVAFLFCFLNGEVLTLLKQRCGSCRPLSFSYSSRRSTFDTPPNENTLTQTIRLTSKNSKRNYASVPKAPVLLDKQSLCATAVKGSVSNGTANQHAEKSL